MFNSPDSPSGGAPSQPAYRPSEEGGLLSATAFPQHRRDDLKGYVAHYLASLPKWTDGLREKGYSGFTIVQSGAFGTGLFRGAKPREHSLNDEVPANFHQVVEGDVRIVFPTKFHPWDRAVIKAVEDVTGCVFKQSKSVTRWNREIPTSYLYGYEDLGNKTGFEWEICINQAPYLEIADKWQLVFTPEEVAWQADLREFLRGLKVDYSTEFSTLKEIQVADCRYRIVACTAMHLCYEQLPKAERLMLTDLPALPPDVSEFLKSLVGLWLKGHSGLVGLDRPSPIASEVSVERLQEQAPRLLNRPTNPSWLKTAMAIQRRIRAENR